MFNKIGLRGKAILWVGFLLLCALIFLGGVTYQQGSDLAISKLLETTQEKIEKDSREIEHSLNNFRADLMVIASTPPVQGIIRARDNRDIDPLTVEDPTHRGDRIEYWYSRLEQIFTAFLKNHPEFYQLRYIDEKGNEIVRADSVENIVKVTPRHELQNKAEYDYFKKTIKLKNGGISYSEVNLNREYRNIQIPHTPVFRIATPVYDSKKKARGIIVINLYARHIFDHIKTTAGGIKKYLANQDGYLLVYPDKTKEFGFDLGFDFTVKNVMPDVAEEIKSKDFSVRYHREEKHIDGFRKIFFDPGDKNRYWVIVHEIPESLALGDIFKMRKTMFTVAILIIAFSVITITWAISKRIISPVVNLAKAAKRMEKGDLSVRVPENSVKDEFNTLYRTINSFAESQQRSIEELEKKVKERTAELEDAKYHAETASRTKSEFLANMSHELRTPLNTIIGFSEMMMEGMAGDMTDQQKEYLNDIHISGEHLLSLIDEILDLSKVEAGKMELELSRFSLRECCESSAGMFREKAKKHGIKLSLDISENMDDFITADERKMRQVMFNLLSNALKFTPDGGSVWVSARRVRSAPSPIPSPHRGEEKDVSPIPSPNRGEEKDVSPIPSPHRGEEKDVSPIPSPHRGEDEGEGGFFIEISIADTGIGISEEDQKRLFQPFHQIETALNKKYPGTGLGLSLCRRFIELHGGRIWVESEEGKGSKFSFAIPIRQ